MSRRPTLTTCRLFASVSIAVALAACAADVPETAETQAPVATETVASADPVEATAPETGASAPETSAGPDGQMEPWAVAAQIGGGLHALAEACGDYSAGELEEMKAEQKRAVVDMGSDPEKFDAAFASSYDQARQKLASVPKAELARECESAQQMKAMAAQMAQQDRP